MAFEPPDQSPHPQSLMELVSDGTTLRSDPRGFVSVLDPDGELAASRFDGWYGAVYDRVIRRERVRRAVGGAIWGPGSAMATLGESTAKALRRWSGRNPSRR